MDSQFGVHFDMWCMHVCIASDGDAYIPVREQVVLVVGVVHVNNVYK